MMFEVAIYPGEMLTGQVLALNLRVVWIRSCGHRLPLDVAQLTWQAIRHPAEVVSCGDRISVIVETNSSHDARSKTRRVASKWMIGDMWLSCLPLIENPWPTLEARYPEGAVVECEMIDYVNWYIARVRMPGGEMIELRTNDIHPLSVRSNQWGRRLFPGERIQVVFRSAGWYGSWVERYFERSDEHACEASGYRVASVAARRKNAEQEAFIESREAAGDARVSLLRGGA
jgi:hypothetical protein